jgi:hypothetical protein
VFSGRESTVLNSVFNESGLIEAITTQVLLAQAIKLINSVKKGVFPSRACAVGLDLRHWCDEHWEIEPGNPLQRSDVRVLLISYHFSPDPAPQGHRWAQVCQETVRMGFSWQVITPTLTSTRIEAGDDKPFQGTRQHRPGVQVHHTRVGWWHQLYKLEHGQPELGKPVQHTPHRILDKHARVQQPDAVAEWMRTASCIKNTVPDVNFTTQPGPSRHREQKHQSEKTCTDPPAHPDGCVQRQSSYLSRPA